MRNKHIITLAIIAITYLTIPLQVNIQAQADTKSIYGSFPYYQSFRSTTKPKDVEIVTPQGGKINSAIFTNNGLRLTPATNQQFGAIFIKDRQFRPIQGIRIEFEYAIYGGTGADGISTFLFDASIESPRIGVSGSGIGYTYNRAIDMYFSSRATGLSGAYIGIALDSYGNSKHRRWQGDSRVSGIPDLNAISNDRYISNVTIRGAQGGATQLTDFPYSGMGTGYNGYPVLISQPTLNNGIGWKLNETNGTYSNLSVYKGDFSLRGENESDYRKAIIEIYPITDDKKGFWITVKIQHGSVTTTVIEDYPYRESVRYTENAYTIDGDYNYDNPATPSAKTTILNTKAPEYLRIGFAASTGGLADIHLIRELLISLPGSSETYDDYASTTSGRSATIDVLNNDIGYSGPIIRNQVGSKDYLNPYTFRFCDDIGSALGTIDTDKTTYSNANGIWQFNFIAGKLTYTPAANFIGEASVKYSIKSGLNDEAPYNDEAYRSLPAIVTVNVTQAKFIISNQMVTPVVK